MYGIVSAQLLITTLVAAIFFTFEPLRIYLSDTWLYVYLIFWVVILPETVALLGLLLYIETHCLNKIHGQHIEIHVEIEVEIQLSI